MKPFAARPGRAIGEPAHRGSSLVELVVAVAVMLGGLLALSRSLTGSIELGQKNREIALATAAAQGMVERLYAADIGRVFTLYNDHPDDDPDGEGSAPGARFAAAGLQPLEAGDLQGRIFFPVAPGSPGELREDLVDSRLRTPLDLDLDGVVDDADHAGDYRLLPVLIRIEWRSENAQRELEVATILGVR